MTMTPAENAVFAILWKQECYNGVTLRDVDQYREGGRFSMGGRVERYEDQAREIVKAVLAAEGT